MNMEVEDADKLLNEFGVPNVEVGGRLLPLSERIGLVFVQRDELLEALKEILKGSGPFSPDPWEHAENCIDAMKEVAANAIAKCKATGIGNE